MRGWFGAVLRDKAGSLEVASVAEGSAAQATGVAAGDEIVAVDGFRAELKQRLARAQAGQTVRLHLFRMDELMEVAVALLPAPKDTLTFVPDLAAGPEVRALRDRWLGAPWPAPDAV